LVLKPGMHFGGEMKIMVVSFIAIKASIDGEEGIVDIGIGAIAVTVIEGQADFGRLVNARYVAIPLVEVGLAVHIDGVAGWVVDGLSLRIELVLHDTELRHRPAAIFKVNVTAAKVANGRGQVYDRHRLGRGRGRIDPSEQERANACGQAAYGFGWASTKHDQARI
jgi:hypothetical protein